MQLRLMGVIAQGEVERIRERSAAGKAHRTARGMVDVAPFGMQVIGGKLKPDDRPFLSELETQKEFSRADLLFEAYDSAVSTGSMHAPWRLLGDRFGFWIDRTGMRRLLLNPALRGAKVGKRNKTAATWADVEEGAGGDPLIDPDDHLAFEAMIRGAMARRSAPDKRQKHVLAGKMICDHCGSLMGRKTVVRSEHGRYTCLSEDCGWLIPGKRRNAGKEKELLESVLLAMADQAVAVAAAMERQATRRDEKASTAPEVKRLQEKRHTYQVLLADGDPVQGVIDELDRQICALMAAGPADGGGHLLQLRESALRRAAMDEVHLRGGIVDFEDLRSESIVAESLAKSWHMRSSWVAAEGEKAIPEELWTQIRELVREVAVHDRKVVRVDLNI